MTYYDTGKQKTLTDPNAGTITYTYDAAGRLKTQVDGKSKTTTNTYDVLGAYVLFRNGWCNYDLYLWNVRQQLAASDKGTDG